MIRGGEIVTWPKLHMIENRFRLEKQIFLGRQSVRKSQRSRLASASPQDEEPNTGTRLPRLMLSPAPTGSDRPLSVDTDAEEAFKNGSRWFFKRGRATPTPTSDTGNPLAHKKSRPDSLRSRSIRRKWSSTLLHENQEADTPQHSTTAPPIGFFSKLRTKSYPSLTLPFSSLQRSGRPIKESNVEEHAWSSESSSEDDLFVDDHRHIRHPSVLNIASTMALGDVDRD
jgi:hypothetical protein